jgi:4,5-dihydroxyphthalate decarboxylase
MVRISLSCGVYDRTLPLLLGMVKPEGIELDVGPLELGRSMGAPDADVYEMPAVGMIMRRAREDNHRALPIFPKRTFFHQLVLTREDSPLTGLGDLRGKRVGLMNWYQHAMGVWLRGHLQEGFGIRPEEIAWTTDRPNAFPMPETSKVQIAHTPEGTTLIDLLLGGELDAVVHEQAHRFLLAHSGLRRLLPDHRGHEATYYHETGCFPINHVLVIRKELAEAEPGIAAALLHAFEEAKQQALGVLDRSNAQVSVAWMDDLLEEERRRLGPDPFAYGLERTRPEIERLVRYLVEQQLIPAPLAVEDIFIG